MMPRRATASERFWANVDKRGPDDCWNWTGCLSEGYGRIDVDGVTWGAHKLSLVIHGRENTTGLGKEFSVMHSCDNRQCVNPSHLSVGPNAQNIRDAWERGRISARGSDNKRHKLSEEAVLLSRSLARRGWTMTRLAKEFGVSRTKMSEVVRGLCWRHVPMWPKEA